MLAEIGRRVYILADLVAVTTSASKKIYWQKLGGSKSACRFSDSHQICQSGKSAFRNAGRAKSAGRFSDCHHICQLGNLQARNWVGR